MSNLPILYRDQFVHGRERQRHRREVRRFWSRLALAAAVIFGAVLGAAVWVNRPEQTAAAGEAAATPTTAAPLPPPPPTTAIVPETVPANAAPAWVTIKVVIPGFDGLGKLVTDGIRADRILPGDPGRAVLAIPADPTNAATVVVDRVEWRVFNRGTVASNNLAALTGIWPVVPVVLLVSSTPGDSRPYVEAWQR